VSTRDEKNELIMYGSDFIGSITNLVPFFYNDDPYLLMYNAGGNANYVNLEFYKYDGFSLPKKTWEVTSLANGYYYFNASQFMFVGNNHRFKTIYNNGNFEINRYTNRYENGFSNTSHVLKFDLTPNMKISYDNMQIVFFEDKNEGLINQIPINIKHDEIMVIDDNVNENNRYIRMLTTYGDGIEFKQGFFDKAIFTKIGEKKIRVDDTYKWYNIKFLVK